MTGVSIKYGHCLLLGALIVMMFALLACGGKKAVTYYHGGYLPQYRMASDGRYYPVDAEGKFLPYNLSYREASSGDNDENYALPKKYQQQDTPYDPNYPLSMQQPAALPRTATGRGVVNPPPVQQQPSSPLRAPVPASGTDNDAGYQLPLSYEQRMREQQDNPTPVTPMQIPPQTPPRAPLPMPQATGDADENYSLPPQYEVGDDPSNNGGFEYPIYYSY